MAVRLSAGHVIGSYTVVDYLAGGGEGDAYLAQDAKGETAILKQHNFSVSDPLSHTALERVDRLRVLVGQRLPHVCEIRACFVQDDLYYVVMERVEGEALDKRLLHAGPMTPSDACALAGDVLLGLEGLHSRDIVHRDVKPANIILAPDGTATLIDIDLALHLGLARLTVGPLAVGTYPYAAPEVLRGRDIDGRSDIHSLGVALFEALTGRLPWKAPLVMDALVREVLRPERPSIRDFAPAVPEALDALVQRFMAREHDDRPASARDALNELAAVTDSLALSVHPLPPRSAASPVRAGTSMALRIETGSLSGTAVVVPKGGVSLGRLDLNPEDGLLSRFHVRAKAGRKGIRLRDIGSRNGLIVGRTRRRRAFLAPGESVLVGRTTLTCVV